MFNYHQPNLENMQQYLTQENERSSGEGPKWWSIPSGMSSVRILPPWDPTGRVALPVFMHPIEYKGEGMSFTKYNWTCVNRTFGKKCPICEGLADIASSGADISNWEATRRQYYFNAIIMHDPTYNQQKGTGIAPGTHVLMKAPKTFYDWVITQITNPMIGDITSITNGIDVYVTKEGTGLGTQYNMTLSPNGRTPIPQEYLDKITDLYNLDDIFSAGFEQKQIDDLVEHLKRSAGVMSNSIPNMQQQMAGYAQAPTPNQYVPTAPNQFQQSNIPVPPQFQQVPTIAPNNFSGISNISGHSPYSNPVVPPQDNMKVPAPASTSSPQENLPKCFGHYDSGSVNCVVCPHEINCSQSK